MGCSPKKDYTRKNRFMLQVSLLLLISELLIFSAFQTRNMLKLLGSKIDLNKRLSNAYELSYRDRLNQQLNDIDDLYIKANVSNQILMIATYVLMTATAIFALVDSLIN